MSVAVVSEGLSERDRAVALRDQIQNKLKELIPIMDQVTAAGMRVEFNLAIDQYGRNQIQRLDIIKVLA